MNRLDGAGWSTESSASCSPCSSLSRGAGESARQAQASSEQARAQLERALNRLDSYMQQHGRSITFQIDQQTGITIVRVFNKATGELVRQIPAEEVVNTAQYLEQLSHGSAVDTHV